MSRPVLLVDDDPHMLDLMVLELDAEGIEHRSASSGAEARAALAEETPSTIVLDLLLPDVHGTELLKHMRKDHPGTPVVVVTAQDDVDRAVECMQLGAADYVQKPFDRHRFLTSIRNARMQGELHQKVSTLTQELRRGEGFDAILGDSPAIQACIEMLRRAAGRDVTVLLSGESGTGKEVAARAVHAESGRASGAFVAVNCGAIPEGLIESELFGHERGSFTGATSARAGCFEQADGGTLFLDEIAELRADLQVRLLRVLQERTVRRVGGSKDQPIDVRVIAATNRDLATEIAQERFREDLYYRLSVFPVQLPPLRARETDVGQLAEHFLRRFAARHARSIEGLEPETLLALADYAWPGNVRELENVIERAVILEDGPILTPSGLPTAVRNPGEVQRAANGKPLVHSNGSSTNGTDSQDIAPFEDEERRILLRALEITGWRIKEAAQRLKIGRATLYRKIERYSLR